VSSDLEPDKRMKVLAHELAHAVKRQVGGNLDEIEAGAVAYVVWRHLGAWCVESPYPAFTPSRKS
jgi:hypothetical protein